MSLKAGGLPDKWLERREFNRPKGEFGYVYPPGSPEFDDWVLYEKDPERHVAYITLNRAEKMNAIPTYAWLKLADLVREAELDDDVKVIIFRGKGTCFGTGVDANELLFIWGWGTAKGDTEDAKYKPSLRERMYPIRDVITGPRSFDQTVLRCTKATICQVHSYCYGAHFQIAMCSDIVVATEDALFTHPVFRYIGGIGDFPLMFEIFGLKKAKEIVLTGRPITAEEAYQFGLVTRVVPYDKLEETVLDFAQAISVLTLDGIMVTKSLMETSLEARGLGVGSALGWIGDGWITNLKLARGEWSFVKDRRDKGVKDAVHHRDSLSSDNFSMRRDVIKKKK